jgi:feruloyl-CoA synthase
MSAGQIRAKLAQALKTLSEEHGSSSSSCPTRLLVLAEPPSIDANEITDKGYINQRAVLERRAALVDKLYASPDSVTTV